MRQMEQDTKENLPKIRNMEKECRNGKMGPPFKGHGNLDSNNKALLSLSSDKNAKANGAMGSGLVLKMTIRKFLSKPKSSIKFLSTTLALKLRQENLQNKILQEVGGLQDKEKILQLLKGQEGDLEASEMEVE